MNTIRQLKAILPKFGMPKVLYSDNSLQYSAVRFKKFSKTWNFEHRMSNSAQFNGMVEHHIQTIKSLLKKGEYQLKDPNLVFIDYKNTPISSTILFSIEII